MPGSKDQGRDKDTGRPAGQTGRSNKNITTGQFQSSDRVKKNKGLSMTSSHSSRGRACGTTTSFWTIGRISSMGTPRLRDTMLVALAFLRE